MGARDPNGTKRTGGVVILGLHTTSEHVQRYAVLIPSMLEGRLYDLIHDCEYGRIVDLCRAELRRRELMEAL